MGRNYTVYLSSTLKDLRDERTAILDVLGGKCIVKQSYGASEDSLIDTCVNDVGTCDMYIGVVGLRYGYVPDDPAFNPDHKSITELEYEAAVTKNLPRYVFLKDKGTIVATNTDSDTGENDAGKLIKDFRATLGEGKEQTPALFTDPADLKTKVLEAFMAFKTRREGSGTFFQSGVRHPGQLAQDVGLVFVPGTDDPHYQAVLKLQQSDGRFKAVTVSPNDPAYLLSLDAHLRNTRSLCWVVTPASLSRLREKEADVAYVLDTVACRTGGRYAWLIGLTRDQLPTDWHFDAVIETTTTDMQARLGDMLDLLHRQVREHCQVVADDERIGLPYVVIALSATEAQELDQQTDQILARYGKLEAGTRATQFRQFRDGVRDRGVHWPDGFYEDTREKWRPFGPSEASIAEILARAVDGLNARRQPGSTEARLLGQKRLQLQAYRFDELCHDRLGSAAVFETLKDRGCVVLVDEFALLHPDLRPHANAFLASQRAAVVSVTAGDPAWCRLEDLTVGISHLQVGALMDRFNGLDYRAEVAMNSPRRLERWLRLVLPNLVTTLGDNESRQELVARDNQALFGTAT